MGEKLIIIISCGVFFFFSLLACNEQFKETNKEDWLIQSGGFISKIYESPDKKNVVLENGLVRRIFRIIPSVACIDYSNLSSGEQLIRAIEPEAKITLDDQEYEIGGLNGQKERAYLKKEWIDSLINPNTDFAFQYYKIQPLHQFFNYKRNFWSSNNKMPDGKRITFYYTAINEEIEGIGVQVHYEIYDGIPLIRKWITINSQREKSVKINQVVHEIIAAPEEQIARAGNPYKLRKPHGIYCETNYAYNNSMVYEQSDYATHWKKDKEYFSQAHPGLEIPCLLEIYPKVGPGVHLHKNEKFTSLHTYELLIDSYDRERRGIMIRRMYRTIMPWTNENPIFMHVVSRNDEQVRTAIDQCFETGYEAVIVSFGSHLNMEDISEENIKKWKTLADYAHSKNIGIGGYSLFSSRRINDETDVIDPRTGKPGGALYGNAPCFGSTWGLEYKRKLKYFLEATDFDILEHDGPYAGDLCASKIHPGHKDLDDSQWKQFEIQKDLYHWCNENGIYINAPDWYFADGTNKICIGYNESNYRLSRDQQKIINRQNIFDALWEKNPSMNWGFVPLTSYGGGDENATIEPLSEHLEDYEHFMIQHYGAGVQACYRGFRLYDTKETKELVVKTIEWYKKYRDLLNGDLIHLRRPDGRNWDGWMMVNNKLENKGMILLFNPLKEDIFEKIIIPLYYTGLTKSAFVREKEGKLKKYPLNRKYEIELPIKIPAESYTWFVVK
jgi:hypothetical protein